MNKNSPRWLITILKGVYVVENFLLGWSPRLRRCPQVAAQCLDGINNWRYSGERQVTSEAWSMSTYSHHLRISLFTSATSSDNNQPTIQNHLKRHLVPSPPTLYYIVLFTTLRTQLYSSNSTQPNSTQQLQPIIRYSVPSRRPHRSVGSTPRISPPEGWRMNPGHRSTLK